MTKKTPLNLLAPVSVSMVAITLGAAFGVLSGRGALIGMISTCLITLMTALVGGSRYGVSSPTGPMTAAIGAILILDQRWLETNVEALDWVGLMNLTLLMAGVILFLLTILKVHKLVKWVPNLVVSGFVNGIALLIIIAQFRTMNLMADWILMGLTFIVALAISRFSKRFSHLAWRVLSGSFMVILGISLLAWILHMNVSYIDLGSSNLSLEWILPQVQLIRWDTLGILLPLAFELALIGLLDTLLTAVIMDKKSRTKTHMTRELSGQSLSLMAASLFGGIPGAQSTVPSMMMYQEKGHHKLSKILLAGFCILFTFAFADLIQFVPLAVFGGIILKIAVDVSDLTSIKTILHESGKHRVIHLAILLGVTLSTVLLSLNLAVIFFTLIFVFWNSFASKKWQIPDLKEDESEGLVDEV